MNDCFIPIQDAADLAGVSVTHVRRLVKNGQVQARKTGSQMQVAWGDIKDFILSQRPSWSLLTSEQLQRNETPEELLIGDDVAINRPESDDFETNRIVEGHCIDWLKRMPLNSIQTVVTSPPYWGVRRYSGNQVVRWSDGTECAFGTEATAEDYVRHTAEIFRALRPVLKDDGTIWWNMGDTYQTRSYIRTSSRERLHAIEGRIESPTWKDYEAKRYSSGHPYLKDKDLTLVPFQVAIAAQRLGFYLRTVIVWSKENVGIDSAKDRPTPSHEYIFLFAKSRFYKYYVERSQEKAVNGAMVRNNGIISDHSTTRKWRSVWTFATSNSHGNHVAAFPLELPLRCINVSTDENDLVFDPFMGSGTTAMAAKKLGRTYFGCDISAEYICDAKKRINTYGEKEKVFQLAEDAQAEQLKLLERSDVQYGDD